MDLQTAQRLYEYRKANGYSQEELSEKIGVSRQAISKWERSESSPDTDNLIALAKLYEITIDELINGSEPPKKSPASEEQTESNASEQEAHQPAAPAGDNVEISFRNGINVESADGDSVHIGFDGIKVNEGNSQEFNDHIFKHEHESNRLFNAIVACSCFLLFIFAGAFIHGGWAFSWVFLLMIPVLTSAMEAVKTKNPSKFAYPLLIVVIYCELGLIAHIWHPTWVLWITIPIYYIMCDVFKKSKAPENPAAQQAASTNGTYYTPNVPNEQTSSAYAQENKSSGAAKAVAIILGLICSACVIGIISYGILAGNSRSVSGTNSIDFDDNSAYSIGSGEVTATQVSGIDIEWVRGNINLEYYDGETISFTESETNEADYQLRYKVKNGVLDIDFCKSGINFNAVSFGSVSKDLTILIPQGKELSQLDIESVSAKVNSNGIAANQLDIETVSGNVTASGSFVSVDTESVSANIDITADTALKSFDAESVSGDVIINLPADISGFSVDADSISSSVNANDFTINGSTVNNDVLKYGDGHITIDFESVSGSLTVKAY